MTASQTQSSKLNRPLKKLFYDVVIIGSGAAGSVMAYNLTRAGLSCLMLEAGCSYQPDEFPDNEMLANSQLMWNGGMDLSEDARFAMLRGKTLGGGTVINGALLDRFDPFAFECWKNAGGISHHDFSTMQSVYDEVESHLSLEEIHSPDWNQNAKLFAQGLTNLGYEWSTLQRGQNNCATSKGNDCIVCLGGCPRESKQSMLVNFLPKAIKQGLLIETQATVEQLIYGKQMVTVGYHKNGRQYQVYGKQAIIAAGSLGTTELLLKNNFKPRLPALGHGFFCHPQYMSMAYFKHNIDSHKGVLQSLKSSDPRFRQAGYKLENVFAGPLAVSMLLPGFGQQHQSNMARYRQAACIEVAIRDRQPGQLYLNNQKRLVIDKQLGEADRVSTKEGLKLVKDIFESLTPEKIIQSPTKIGLHLMGGCAIGNDASRAVVNENYQVYDHPNLLIADSSIFPAAPGINPSLTIMAEAQKASSKILQTWGIKNSFHETGSAVKKPISIDLGKEQYSL